MARTSRKVNHDAPANVSVGEKVYKTAIYGRLSISDTRDGEGGSLDDQLFLLKKYVDENPSLKLVSVYSDNGQTGTNFERSGFERLMDDVKKGKVNCIVVKDLSRFGRNYIEAGNYIEILFPFLNVRFIAIGDNFDSFDPRWAGEGLVVALKNLINDVYAKDISQKITSALHTKKLNGEYIGSYAPFGYIKSPENKNRLIIDKEAAVIVSDIFRWKLEGMPLAQVAKHLNEMKIPSPSYYRYLKGISKNKRFRAGIKWQDYVVKNVLTNIVYVGHMVNGKSKKHPEQGYTKEMLSKDQWIIIENTHEPIVSLSDFNTVADMFRQTSENYFACAGKYAHLPKPENIFKGIPYCAFCGRKLKRVKNFSSRRDMISYTYICRNCKSNTNDGANWKRMKETDLTDAVYGLIRKQIELCTDIQSVYKRIQSSHSVIEKRQLQNTEITNLRKNITRIDNLLTSLYVDYSENKILTENEYQYAKAEYDHQKDVHIQRMDELLDNQKRYSPNYVNENQWVTVFQSFCDEKTLTREMLTALIERIDVLSDKKVIIVFR